MASCPVRLSLWRGVAGFSLLAAAFLIYPQSAAAFVVLLLGSLYFFKGCPACWVSGFFEARRQKRDMQAAKDANTPAAPPEENA